MIRTLQAEKGATRLDRLFDFLIRLVSTRGGVSW